MKFRLIVLFILTNTLISCNDNELDINGHWKETPVVYAIIDMGQDSQIFRIQKTYQNNINQSTADVAQIADSLTMKNINVVVVNNVTGDSTTLKRLAPRKESGFFSNKDSCYWGENLSGFFTPAHTYSLLIRSNHTGNTYKAVTNIVQPFTIQSASTIDLSSTIQPNLSFRVTAGGMNALFYDIVIRINYKETPIANPNDSINKSLDFYFITNKETSASGTTFSTSVPKSQILDYIKRAVQINPNVTRTYSSLDYVVMGANKTYNDMIQVNSPSNSVIGKGADFTNISDGIGVFASRTASAKEQPVSVSTVTLLNQMLNP